MPSSNSLNPRVNTARTAEMAMSKINVTDMRWR